MDNAFCFSCLLSPYICTPHQFVAKCFEKGMPRPPDYFQGIRCFINIELGVLIKNPSLPVERKQESSASACYLKRNAAIVIHH